MNLDRINEIEEALITNDGRLPDDFILEHENKEVLKQLNKMPSHCCWYDALLAIRDTKKLIIIGGNEWNQNIG